MQAEDAGGDASARVDLERLVGLQADVLAALTEGRSVERIAGRLLEAVCGHLGWPAAFLERGTPEGAAAGAVAAHGPAGPARAAAAGVVARVLHGGEAQGVPLAGDAPAAQCLLQPVPLGTRTVGVLGLLCPTGAPIPPARQAFLAGVAALCGPLVGRGPLPFSDGRSEEQILRAHRLESLGHLAGGVAHDVNNVLGVILGYVELAKMSMHGADAKVDRHLGLALSTLGRARALADRLLDFAREKPRRAELCDLNEAVLEVRELLSETIDRRIEFEVHLGSGLPPPPLDIDALRQVVTNLCLNAAAAMPQGGRIRVDTFRREVRPGGWPELPPGVYCALRVGDTGPGVAPAARARIFRPYYTTNPSAGSGMGLWVVRGLVERFGGRVEVGGDDQGAVFTVWMPSELRVWPRESPAGADEAPEGGPVDVLVVDDEPGVREITRAFLEMDGYRVIEASSGAEALALLAARPGGVRVVFLDHLLGDARGAELAWQIDRMEGAPHVVLVTGLPGAAGVEELPAGTRVLPKPFLHDDVSRLLRVDLGILPDGTTAPA